MAYIRGAQTAQYAGAHVRAYRMEDAAIVDVALRVMSHVDAGTQPEVEDLEALRQFARDQASLPPYDLACVVIQRQVEEALAGGRMPRSLIRGTASTSRFGGWALLATGLFVLSVILWLASGFRPGR